MSAIHDIPEIASLDRRRELIRIPPEQDVPLTARVRRVIDTPEFRRLSRISQLGLVSLVYPAAHHTRFEHSLGVYRLALDYLKQLSYDARFAEAVPAADAELFIVSALLHDVGHWPFCHPIEDMRLAGVPTHEFFARRFLENGELAGVLQNDWGIDPRRVTAFLSETTHKGAARILAGMLSGPIDIDKMDYLFRDSLHAGVPYGRHFDRQRLIGSLCLNSRGDGLAITDKGKTAAELMVFARYVMFSEVYWHHAVRSATAMLQRAFYLLLPRLDLTELFCLAEEPMIDVMKNTAAQGPAGELLDGLFGPVRRLYKRVAQFDYFEQREAYELAARQPYPRLAACAENLAGRISRALGKEVAPHEVLIDAPPIHREAQIHLEVHLRKENRHRPLEDVSPVVRTLARDSFDDYVKRVRVFAHPNVAAELRRLSDMPGLLADALAQTPA